jgi:long-chain acyl-CoA synthetase
MVLGGKDKDLVAAIINIDFDNVGKWAEEQRIAYTTFVDLSQRQQVAALVRKEVDRVNQDLPEETRLKKYVLLHKEFDPDEAELTRTRKLRRSFMEQRYADIVNAIYSDKHEFMVEAPVTYRDGRKGIVSTALRVWAV